MYWDIDARLLFCCKWQQNYGQTALIFLLFKNKKCERDIVENHRTNLSSNLFVLIDNGKKNPKKPLNPETEMGCD